MTPRHPAVTPLKPVRLNGPDAAQYCGYAPKSFANLRALGSGPKFTRSGKLRGRVFYMVCDLDAWMAEQATNSGVA